MADGITLNSGSGGDTLAADDVAGTKYPIQKVAYGALDSVTLAASGAGAVSAGVQRVTLASDDPAVTDLAAIEVLLGTIDSDTGTLAVVGGGLEATALRVTIASDSTGVVSIDDNGGAITVDGTVAVTNAGLTELAAAINASSQMDVNIAASNASVAVTNAGITTIAGAVSGTEMQVDVVAALPAGTNAIGKLAANSGVDIGDVDVTSIAAGTNNIGNVGIIPRTSGGMTIFRSIDIDESEEEVKATAGQLFSISAFNTTAAPLYLKFYNATAANVTVGTTTPVLTFAVPGNADSDGAGFVWNNEIGFAFGTAISVACTTGVADNDTGAPGANACIINLGYA